MENGRKGTGRKKIEIKKIEKIQQLNVSFSKRRQGLFHKAEKLCILCGVEIVVVVFSPTGRLHTFGYPSVDSVMERFQRSRIGSGSGSVSGGYELVGFLNEHELFNESPEIESEVDRLLNVVIECLGMEELEQYKVSLEEMKRRITMRAEEIMMRKFSYGESAPLRIA